MQEKKIVMPPEGSIESPSSEVAQKTLPEAEAKTALTSRPALPHQQAGPESVVSQPPAEAKEQPPKEPIQLSTDSSQGKTKIVNPEIDHSAVNQILKSNTDETSDLASLVDKLNEAQVESEA